MKLNVDDFKSNEIRLEITSFKKEDAGDYFCIAINEFGEQAVEIFHVQTRFIRNPPFIYIASKFIQAVEGSSISINFTSTVS